MRVRIGCAGPAGIRAPRGQHATNLRIYRRAAPRSSPQRLTHTDAHEALKHIRTLILDCDGVLWRGEKALPGVPEALAALRSQGMRLLFVTNNSSKSRAQCAASYMYSRVEMSQLASFAPVLMLVLHKSRSTHLLLRRHPLNSRVDAPIVVVTDGRKRPYCGVHVCEMRQRLHALAGM